MIVRLIYDFSKYSLETFARLGLSVITYSFPRAACISECPLESIADPFYSDI